MIIKTSPVNILVKRAASLFSRESEMNEERFIQSIDPVKDALFNYILKALNFSGDAEDIYQETVLRAFRYRNKYQENMPFKTWIFAIAHNEINRYFKRARKITIVPVLDDCMPEIPEDREQQENIRKIYEIACNLDEKNRNVFFLFYDHGFSIREIAEITGLREGNIKFILSRAREAIKAQLKQ